MHCNAFRGRVDKIKRLQICMVLQVIRCSAGNVHHSNNESKVSILKHWQKLYLLALTANGAYYCDLSLCFGTAKGTGYHVMQPVACRSLSNLQQESSQRVKLAPEFSTNI